MNQTIIDIENFSKRYGEVTAVDQVSFSVKKGEIFGLLGPNGAGKTTTLECLEGIRQRDTGSMRIMEVDPANDGHRLRNLIGVQLQTSGLPDNMTVEESMRFFCAYHNVAPRHDLLDQLGLQEKHQTQYHQLSTGQKRRLALALAIAHNPPVLILDEPTAGLDVASRTTLHKLMVDLRANGTTILLATHDMAEAEKLTDRIAILLKGKIVALDTVRDITARGSGYTKVSVRTERSVLADQNQTFPAVTQSLAKDEYSIYFTTDPGPTVSAIIAHIQEQDDRLIDLRVERPSLEERFLEITNTGA